MGTGAENMQGSGQDGETAMRVSGEALADAFEHLLDRGHSFDGILTGMQCQLALIASAHYGPEGAAGVCDAVAAMLRRLPERVRTGEVRLHG